MWSHLRFAQLLKQQQHVYWNSLTKVVPGALTWICVNTGGLDLRPSPGTRRAVSWSWKNAPLERLVWCGTSIYLGFGVKLLGTGWTWPTFKRFGRCLQFDDSDWTSKHDWSKKGVCRWNWTCTLTVTLHPKVQTSAAATGGSMLSYLVYIQLYIQGANSIRLCFFYQNACFRKGSYCSLCCGAASYSVKTTSWINRSDDPFYSMQMASRAWSVAPIYLDISRI